MMFKFIDDDDLTDNERQEISHILNHSAKHDPKCFFMDDPKSVAALQRYEKLHGPLPAVGYLPAPVIPNIHSPTNLPLIPDAAQHYPASIIQPPHLGTPGFAPFLPAHGFFATAPPPTATTHSMHHPAAPSTIFYQTQPPPGTNVPPGHAPAAALPYFLPLYLPSHSANPMEMLALQQAARVSMDPRIAASMHLAAVHSSSAAAAALAAAASAHAVINPPQNQYVHCADGKIVELPIIDEMSNPGAPGDVTTSSSSNVAGHNVVGLARDIVPVDPEPIQKQLLQDMPQSLLPQTVLESQQKTYYHDSHVLETRTDETATENLTNDEEELNEEVELAKATECEPNTEMADAKTTGVLDEDLNEVVTRPNDACTDSFDLLSQTDEQSSPNAKATESTMVSPHGKLETSPTSMSATAGGPGQAVPAASGNKSWASLFRNTPTATNAIVISKLAVGGARTTDGCDDESLTDSEKAEVHRAIERSLQDASTSAAQRPSAPLGGHSGSPRSPSEKLCVTTVDRDPPAQKLGKSLTCYKLEHRGPMFHLRGLKNVGNWCYINATLQALLACPPFVHLLRSLKNLEMRTPTSTPMLDALVKFVGEFSNDRHGRRNEEKCSSFEPTYVYNVLSSLRNDTSFSGRQEDAEEFLGLVLNQLHEEMNACITYSNENTTLHNGDIRRTPVANSASSGNPATVQSNNDANEWRQVVPGRRLAVTRTSKLGQSPIVEIFSGVMRNAFQQSSSKESVALESFFTLQLSVQSNDITSLFTALQQMNKEIISRPDPPRKGEITRRSTFQELPIVLILHLKYFSYVDDSVKKHLKPISYSMDLQIDRSMTVPAIVNQSLIPRMARSYKLFAVVFHHGEEAHGGHYTADIFHGGQWLAVDDAKVEPVDEAHVLDFRPPRVPYLLFYRRCDVFVDRPFGAQAGPSPSSGRAA